MRAADIMTTSVVTVPPSATLKSVARLLVERDISAMPVLDETGSLVGMISEADVMHLQLHEDPRRHVRVPQDSGARVAELASDVMTVDVLAIPPDHDVADVAQLMLDRQVRSLPVVDAGSVVGIVSRRDVLRVLVRTDAEITRDLEDILDDLPSSLGSWSVTVHDGVVQWRGSGPDDVPPFLKKVAFTIAGVVDAHVDVTAVP
jgi:CBS domain-containing protein